MKVARDILVKAVLLAFCASALASLLPDPAHGFEIRVRGQGKLYADVQPAGITVQVAGALRDELGNALPQRDVRVRILSANSNRELHKEVLSTDMQGRFQLQRSMDEGDYIIEAEFLGTEHLDGDKISREAHLVIIPPQVDIHVPKLVVGASRPANLRVRASAAGVGISAPVEVWVNGSEVTDLDLDLYGRGALDVVPYLQPGENVVEVRLPKERKRPAASDASTLRYSAAPEIEVQAAASQQRLERGLLVTGKVFDEIGPLGKGSVKVEFERVGPVPGQELDEITESPVNRGALDVRTEVDKEGRFEGFLPGQLIDDGQWRARVTYRPDAGAVLEAATQTVTFDRTRSRWLLNLLGLLAILVGVVVLVNRLSTVDFRSFFASLRRKQDAPKEAPRFDQDEPAIIEQIEPEEADVVADSETQIAGVVWDGWRRRAVPFARIELARDGKTEHTIQAMSDGRFRSPNLEAGRWHMRVSASGFASGILDFEIPHDGAYRFFRFGLVAIPLKIRRFYQSWVRRIHGEDLWGKLSPRQIEGAIWGAFDTTSERIVEEEQRHVLKERLLELLEREQLDAMGMDNLLFSVTEIVEESYFSSRVHDEQLWNLLVAITQRLDELAAGIEADRDAEEAP